MFRHIVKVIERVGKRVFPICELNKQLLHLNKVLNLFVDVCFSNLVICLPLEEACIMKMHNISGM